MRTIRQILFVLIAGFASIAKVMAVPVVDWNTVSISCTDDYFNLGTSTSGGAGAGIEGLLFQDDAGLWANLTANRGTVGIAYRWFAVGYGELINFGLAESSDPFADNITSEYGSIHLDNDQSFYFGFRLGGPDYLETEYGWAELLYDGTAVSVLSSATERTGLGIYAGTGTAIPEPTTAGLLLIGAMGLAWKRRRA